MKGNKCNYPCKYLTTSANILNQDFIGPKDGQVRGKINLLLLSTVKKTTAYHSFGLISLLGEIGGYLGLFLGYSIYNIADLMDYCLLLKMR